MSTLLLKHADLLVTMDAGRRRIVDGGLFVRGREIVQVGPTAALPEAADIVLDATGMIVLPGLVNTHHHLYQTLTRCIAQDNVLFDWLVTLYPIWARLTPEAVYVSAKVGLAELMLSGCTTSSDHLYIYPNGVRIDDEIRAAVELGIRFHATRGSMSLGRGQGGLPPDNCVEDEAFILRESRRAIETYHQADRFGMVRVALAPCSPFTVTADIMRSSAELARAYGVRLHTHLAETKDEEEFCLEKFGARPVDYVASLGWTGPDVWHAHCVHLNAAEVGLFAATGSGVAHCPSSNMRLASGIAPVRALRDAGVNVGLGVDGSASNDSSHLLAEARQAMLLQRVTGDPNALGAQEALEIATLGGAAVLGRDDIGSLAPGMAADFIGYRLDRLSFAGARHDPLAALVFCTPLNVDLSVIDGRVRVRDGQIVGLDTHALAQRHNEISRELIRGD
ncbi:MAG: 8-oxoguanine deaminase [Chloroflexi bacterium ADurb.Bin325]|nr:MAG: 8-oxoguanine deaminase [Chloroflexi bacterium ADurb.Bin325]